MFLFSIVALTHDGLLQEETANCAGSISKSCVIFTVVLEHDDENNECENCKEEPQASSDHVIDQNNPVKSCWSLETVAHGQAREETTTKFVNAKKI